ncbi:MAG TPA: hypothetical protein VGQ86_11700 [Candidatus Limnocylindria bacterium]|nr:hypothetical protein [Candidatus Limnocylindria bacterium]
MADTGILTTLATIGMSLAGFAGLISALIRKTEWRPLDLLLIRTQVSYGFAGVLFALIPIPLTGLFGADIALRAAGITLLLASAGWGFIGARDSRRLGIAWRRRLPFTALAPVQIGTAVWAAVVPSLEVYELAVICVLAYAMPVFFFALTELGRARD